MPDREALVAAEQFVLVLDFRLGDANDRRAEPKQVVVVGGPAEAALGLDHHDEPPFRLPLYMSQLDPLVRREEMGSDALRHHSFTLPTEVLPLTSGYNGNTDFSCLNRYNNTQVYGGQNYGIDQNSVVGNVGGGQFAPANSRMPVL